jgi:signal transduction histidine kinase
MTEAMPLARPDLTNRRLLPLVTVGPYVLLVLLSGFTLLAKHDRPGSLAIDLGLCAATGVWILALFTLRPAWRLRPGPMLVFFAGVVGFTAVLVLRDPWFGCFAPACYLYAFTTLRWPVRLLGVATVAVIAATAQASDIPKDTTGGQLTYLGVIAINVAPMGVFAWVDWYGDRQADARALALAETGAANRRLEATLAENKALHQQLVEQARAAGVHDERQRMAREIHDTIAQGLTGIVTQLQAAEAAAGEPERWRRHFAAATRLARESLTEARRSVDALRPQPLESARLREALAGVAERWTGLHGIAVQVTTTGTVRVMPPEHEVALLRTAQEALANVAKHANATRVGLTLSYLEHEVALDVRDDGTGFDARRASAGFGLVAMRQRVEDLAGTLRVESEVGGGTAISACVPLPR